MRLFKHPLRTVEASSGQSRTLYFEAGTRAALTCNQSSSGKRQATEFVRVFPLRSGSALPKSKLLGKMLRKTARLDQRDRILATTMAFQPFAQRLKIERSMNKREN